MSLTRKQKKQLNRLQNEAQKVWEQQQAVASNAASVAKEAARQLGKYNREQVVPVVQQAYDANVKPHVDNTVKFGKKVNKQYVSPALATAAGSALAAWDAANQKRVEIAAKRGFGAGFLAEPIVEEKKKRSAGGVFALILGIGAAAAVLYAAFKAYTADDELWVADEPLALDE